MLNAVCEKWQQLFEPPFHQLSTRADRVAASLGISATALFTKEGLCLNAVEVLNAQKRA